MIFNTALPSSGGGSSVSGWTDVSSAFIDTDATSLMALTDGTLMYITAEGWTYITIPSAYAASRTAAGSGYSDGGRPGITLEDSGTIAFTDTEGTSIAVCGTIVYPLA